MRVIEEHYFTPLGYDGKPTKHLGVAVGSYESYLLVEVGTLRFAADIRTPRAEYLAHFRSDAWVKHMKTRLRKSVMDAIEYKLFKDS